MAVSLACFVLFFGVMAIRLSLGDDPALGSDTASSAAGTGEARTREEVGSEAPAIEERSLFGEGFGEGESQIEPEAVHSGQS